jgi:uncharacterized protein DUF5819
VQERVESSALGRVVISVLIVLVLVCVLTANLPRSELQHRLLSADHHMLYGLGLDQNWNLFAPDPRRQTIALEARIVYADGSREVWRPPSGGALVGAYWDYRWRKWYEQVTQSGTDAIWTDAARYVARTHAARRPVRVSLVSRWYDLPPPGHVSDAPVWHSRTFFTLPIAEPVGS